MKNSWICSQLGTREYYLIPRALKKVHQDVSVITDHWVRPGSLLYKYYPKSRTRFHESLRDIDVFHFNNRFLFKRLFSKETNWDIYYDSLAAKKLKQIFTGEQKYLFTNSYTCLNTLQQAKDLGLHTYYQQINPGPEEAEIVKRIYKEEFGDKYKPEVPDDDYWDRWRCEINIADSIIVNSKWSETLLIRAGIEASRISIIPFIYEGSSKNVGYKLYPEYFSDKRPLRLLFLGSLSIRKGFHILKNAMQELKHHPVVLDVVGRLNGPEELLENLSENINYLGQIPSYDISKYYEKADVFILPTLSDGFALTQMEAQSYKLPVITTPFCGDVIKQDENGIVLQEVSIESIKTCILTLLEKPGLLKFYSENSLDLNKYSLENVGNKILNIRVH